MGRRLFSIDGTSSPVKGWILLPSYRTVLVGWPFDRIFYPPKLVLHEARIRYGTLDLKAAKRIPNTPLHPAIRQTTLPGGGGKEFENNTSGEFAMRTDFLPNILWIRVFRALFLLGTNTGTAMRQLPQRILPLANRS